MTVLVTGGTGFIGSAVVRRLLERGQAVRVLARSTSKTEHLETQGVEIVRGDILDPASIEAALAGCETLYHIAALYDFWGIDKPTMMKTAKQGTQNVLEAARHAQVSKIVYTSSTVALGEQKGETGTEATQHRGYYTSFYERTKHEGERIARDYQTQGLPLVIVMPGGVYGPGDFKPTGRSVINLLNGKVPLSFPAAFSAVFIDDVAAGHVLAAEKGQIGERYILASHVVTTREWFGAICELAGIRMPSFVPGWFFYPMAYGGEWFARLTHKPPAVSVDHLRFLIHGNRADGSRATRELGLQYTPLEEGLRKTIAWYWEQGLLKRKPACVNGS